MRKIIKKAILIIILFLIFSHTNNVSLSKINTDIQINETAGISWLQPGNVFLGVIQVVGTIISVIMLIVIGIKYMFGSVSEKAENKTTLLYYLIGAILLFTTSNIATIIYDLIKKSVGG